MKFSKILSFLGIDEKLEKDIEIKNLSTLSEATASSLSFFHNEKYKKELKNTKAAAIFIQDKFKDLVPSSSIAIIVDEPYKMIAKVTELFKYKPSIDTFEPILEENVKVAKSANFGKNVKIGKNSIIMAGVYLGDNVEIGENCIIYPNVTIYYNCKIASNVTIHSGTVIGSDGFGFANDVKFYQIGNVVIGDNVEIGSNCSIDRAALGSTKIESNVKMDNLIQIGHNCEIGEGSIIVSQVGLSGSTILGKAVIMGGQSATAGHLKIGDKAILAARSGVTKSLLGGKIYGGFPAVDIKLWRKMQVVLMRLVKKNK